MGQCRKVLGIHEWIRATLSPGSVDARCSIPVIRRAVRQVQLRATARPRQMPLAGPILLPSSIRLARKLSGDNLPSAAMRDDGRNGLTRVELKHSQQVDHLR